LALECKLTEFFKGSNPQNTLIVFPYGGGSHLDFREWQSPLLDRFRCLAVQYPGHGMAYGEPLATDLDSLLTCLYDTIRTAVTGNTLFFGHSLGAITAFEITRRLNADGIKPRHLFLSGLSAPHLPRRNAPVHQLSNAAFDRELLAYGGLPSFVTDDPAMMDFIRPIQRADFGIWEKYNYQAGSPLSCPITALAGEQDSHYPPEDVQPWCEHTSAAYAFQSLPGGHIYVHDNKDAIMAKIAAAGV